jgi:prepilin signal peptidase PulO-like enzyme (type II secretory pathway)
VLLGLVLAFLLGGAGAAVLLAPRIASRRDLLPFGPYLSAGALATLLAGDSLLRGYAAVLSRAIG